ncbi:MAG: BamA/TamA family outer membrane protein, partial [Bacteroidia bacterium]
MLIKKQTLLLLLFFVTHLLNAQDEKRKFFGFSRLDDTVATDKNGFFILPLLYYTPDTRWAAGAAGVYYFKIPPKFEHEEETRISYVQFLADYTQNRQLDVWGQWKIFTRNENFLLEGEMRYRDFPDRFYGIGNQSLKSNSEKYEYNYISLKSLMLKRVSRKYDLFAGIDYQFEYEYGFTFTPGGSLEQGTITGYKGGTGSAIGLVAIYDSRDNLINAYSGQLMELSSYFFTPVLGSTFSYWNINATYQKYWQVRRKHILAVQAKARHAEGEVPFLDMPTLGNDDILRGYPKNRFRDKNFVAAQVEYRFPVWWRFGFVGFAGAGDVFAKPSDVSMRTLKYSVGAGVRFVVNP